VSSAESFYYKAGWCKAGWRNGQAIGDCEFFNASFLNCPIRFRARMQGVLKTAGKE
jgi:hypothetical protein